MLVGAPSMPHDFHTSFPPSSNSVKLQDEEVEAQSPNNLSQVHRVTDEEWGAEPRSPTPELEQGQEGARLAARAASSAPMPSPDTAVQSEAGGLEIELDFLRHTVCIVGLDLSFLIQ